MKEPVVCNVRAYKKRLDREFLHRDFWILSECFGVSLMWLLKWRYRLLVHRSPFMDEATIFRMLHGPGGEDEFKLRLAEASSCGRDARKGLRELGRLRDGLAVSLRRGSCAEVLALVRAFDVSLALGAGPTV